MEKKKEIEKMAKVLYGIYCGEDKCGECKNPNCESYRRAELLYNAGYRKFNGPNFDYCIYSSDKETVEACVQAPCVMEKRISEIRKETAREIVNLLHENNDLRHIEYFIAEKYDVRVEE